MTLKTFLNVDQTSHFPIQNLPFGIFSTEDNSSQRVGTRIGDWVLDLNIFEELGFFNYHLGGQGVFAKPSLNDFMALGRPAWREARTVITNFLRADNPTMQDQDFQDLVLTPVDKVTMHLPVQIGDYTDFYASKEHATNVGTMFRGKENALLPNWRHLPVGYHGRASSVILSGQNFHRPRGQVLARGEASPIFASSERLDFELEMGVFVGPGNALGQPILMSAAEESIFGMVLLNDWSARDIQSWEYRPLGPFLGKNFATSISPWVVTLDALEPFKTKTPEQDPEPLAYLKQAPNSAYDIKLEVLLQTESMLNQETICRSNLKHMYWSIFQQLVHHSITGCNLRTGDLLGTGTISGLEPGSFGSMLELTWQGENPIELPGGETRRFLEDGDRITLTGYCQGDGYRVGFGEVTTKILPAR